MIIKDGDYTLKAGLDYKQTDDNSFRNAGEYQITISGLYNYNGSCNKTFVITPAKITEEMVTVSDCVFYGSAVTPKPIVETKEAELTEGQDYTIAYENNDKLGTGYVVVTGIGNLEGSVKVPFKITESSHSCGNCMDRDVNAAVNIREEGRRLLKTA